MYIGLGGEITAKYYILAQFAADLGRISCILAQNSSKYSEKY